MNEKILRSLTEKKDLNAWPSFIFLKQYVEHNPNLCCMNLHTLTKKTCIQASS